jgi:2-phospho-L-lactate guanylyltransferase
MRVVVPFDARDPNTRLGPFLTDDERRAFAETMLRDVLAAVRAAGGTPAVLANGPVQCDAPVTVDESALTDAVNAELAATEEPVAVVMADLALATPAALERLFAATGDVVFAPGLGGGTNGIVVRHPEFRVDYHGASIRDHVRAARALGASVRLVDSFRLAVDVDEPADLREVLLHAEGAAADWLREAGVALAVSDGEPTITRTDGAPDEGA